MKKKDIIVLAGCILLVAGCLVYAFLLLRRGSQDEAVYEALRPTTDVVYVEETPEVEEEVDPTYPIVSMIDFNDWYAINEDVIGYIMVPNTNISYPVLQHPTEDDYYLSHTIEDVEDWPGCIYIQSYQSALFEDAITILYGHNLPLRGTMFTELHSFEDDAFFEENDTFTLYIPTEEDPTLNYELTCEIYANIVYTDAHLFSMVDYSSEEDQQKLLDILLESDDERNHIREGVEPLGEGDKLVILSTCIRHEEENRFLVIGILRAPSIVT